MLTAFANGTLFGEGLGSGKPRVIGLHGWQRSHTDLLPAFSDPSGAELDALALDLPGFGASPPPERGWTTAEYAGALSPVLEICADEIVVVGHSFGGRVALHLAAQHPERVTGLVLTGVPLLAPGGPRRRPAAGYRARRAARRLGVISEARLEAARLRYGSSDYKAANPVLRAVLVACVGESYDAVLEELTCPVSLVWGANDTVAPVALAQRAAARYENVTLELVEGVDHFLPTRAPAALRRALDGLVAR